MDRRSSRRGRPPAGTSGRLIALGLLATASILLAGCSSGSSSGSSSGGSSSPPTGGSSHGPVPAELRAGCGKPGTEVTLVSTTLPVTVDKGACDLAGVTVHWKDGTDTVPGGTQANPDPTTCTSSSGATCPSITVDAKTGAVTIAPAG